jgi:hypothetical protein
LQIQLRERIDPSLVDSHRKRPCNVPLRAPRPVRRAGYSGADAIERFRRDDIIGRLK